MKIRQMSIVLLLCAVTAVTTYAQVFTTLAKFDGSNGTNPAYESLVQGPDGTVVTISGVSLAQTAAVAFADHVSASFTVISDTQVITTVPQGAINGKLGIQTQGGVAVSPVIFTVTQ